ncbi:NAD-dependent epimerase/dehydratase [Catenulispora acidiphila DSM 44928]|uniref:NAD-dependent epimerase/dehydratase n=1 Tax=Catenulispora acidiphila (strain DSM 44928 / JCM 14897 / NBRC 102108 / NRRL B-24433 / ID139908) TaxID=479433 RepID=C7QE61_CATAD|nr:NAD(P)-dependent oxidoreductase [Catenulispora acidiphila]ACU76649.1 NAD-dependent epimerase/dehydratase [Catenulispora acidiphila DSM 44928]
MRILLAGASGVFGRVLTPALIDAGHEVVGITRTPDGVRAIEAMGAGTVVADVMDRAELLAAVEGHHFDAVISQLTALKKPPMRNKDMDVTNTLRTVGTENLMAAAKATGATRFLTQSMIFGYGYGDLGPGRITEDAFFGPSPRRAFARHGEAMLRNEQIAFSEPGIDGIALRYGLFYGGPATNAYVEGLQAGKMPLVKAGTNSFVHLADAASATVAAVERGKGGEAYNVVDDAPAPFADVALEIAKDFGTKTPRTVPAWLTKPMPYLHCFITGRWIVSNAKAKDQLGWQPQYPSFHEGVHADARAAGIQA